MGWLGHGCTFKQKIFRPNPTVTSTSNIRLVDGFIFLQNRDGRDETSTEILNTQSHSLSSFGNHANSETSCVLSRKRLIEFLRQIHQAGNADHQIAPPSRRTGGSKYTVTSKPKSSTLVCA